MKSKYDPVKVIPNMTIHEAENELATMNLMLDMLIDSTDAEYRDPEIPLNHRELAARKREVNQYINELEHTIAFLQGAQAK
jgi:hypothetical protein